ncbi:LysR family transcriptional regulator substrate-binding protein [Nonomuraea sp. NPDC049625]|uniref:LysR family transcriptional regulator substrate-binding protein n=1 Tax=Nonomuraea sp. NPDC049625 TaxID=3155775 RepID=UPI00343906DC
MRGGRLLERLFAARGLTQKIVCEVDEPSSIADLIGAGLGIGLVPSFARHTSIRAPLVAITVDSPDCRRARTPYWGADSHLSTAARLMRTMITNWSWTTGDAPASHSEGLSGQ